MARAQELKSTLRFLIDEGSSYYKKKHIKNLDKFDLNKNLIQYKRVIDAQFKKV